MKLVDKLQGKGLGAVLAQGSLGSFTVKSAGILAALASHVLLTRLLGTESYGVYCYVISWLTVLVVLAKLGQDAALIRFVPVYRADSNWPALKGLLGRSNRLVLLTSLAFSLLLAGVILTQEQRLDTELKDAFLVGCLVLPLSCLLALREGALQGLKRVVSAQLPARVLIPLFLAFFLGASYLFLARRLNGASALWCALLAHAVAFTVSSFRLRRLLDDPIRKCEPVYFSRTWFTVGVGMLLVSGQYLIMNRVDILMLGYLAGRQPVGIYAVAVRLAWLVPFMLEASSAIAAPLISELYAGKRTGELQRLVHLVIWASTVFSGAMFIILVVGGKFFLSIFGPEFTAGYICLVVLAVGQLVNSLTGPSGLLLSMTGHERRLGALLFLALVLNTVLNYLLIPLYGILGAAAATAAVNILFNIGSVILVKRLLGIYSLIGFGAHRIRNVESKRDRSA